MDIYLQDKIVNFIHKDEGSGCWLWTGQISNSGHGKIMVKNKDNNNVTLSAHHVSYLAFNGEIPDGQLSRPTCGNRLCVNPQHLELFVPAGVYDSPYIKVIHPKK